MLFISSVSLLVTRHYAGYVYLGGAVLLGVAWLWIDVVSLTKNSQMSCEMFRFFAYHNYFLKLSVRYRAACALDE